MHDPIFLYILAFSRGKNCLLKLKSNNQIPVQNVMKYIIKNSNDVDFLPGQTQHKICPKSKEK